MMEQPLLSQKPIPKRERLIFALDVPTVLEARRWVDKLGDSAQDILATNGANLTAATKNIRLITEDVQAGKGLAGTLLQNPQVSTNVQSLAENLSQASSNLNRFGLWHFLWSHPPAGTNAKTAPLQAPRTRK